jgi:TPP-dependent 2-oxoacid decarboxylase
MNSQKTIDHIDQLCGQADVMILQGKNADQMFTLHLREITEQTLRKSFKEIKYKMNLDYAGKVEISKTLSEIASLITKDEFHLNQTVDYNNKSHEISTKIQNFEQKWLWSIPYIHEAGIDQLFRVLLINRTTGFDAALAYLRGERKTIRPRPFDPKLTSF